MRQEVPKCGKCEEERQAAKAYRKSLAPTTKGKARMTWSGDDGDDAEDDDDEWGGGEPGIIKVCLM